MGVTSGVAHLFESIGEMIEGVFAAIVELFKFVVGSIAGVFKGFVNFVEGTLGFAFRELLPPSTTYHLVLRRWILYTPCPEATTN